MKRKICFIYPWATLGGVERVFINRAKAFAYSKTDTEMAVFFLHFSAGLKKFQAAIEKERLSDYCKIVTKVSDDYDFIIPIDTEDGIRLALDTNCRILIECHTPYKENRSYLRKIHPRCEAIIVPSKQFKNEITLELGSASTTCHVIENFVPWDLDGRDNEPPLTLPEWVGYPILYLGRLDSLKNYDEFISAMSIANQKFPGRFFPIICGPISNNINIIQKLKNAKLFGKSLYLPAIPFGSVKPLLKALALKKGIFVSPSKGESFGLSAAEALSYGMPALLSNISPHLQLVKPHEREFSYPLGNPDALVERLDWISSHYDTAVSFTHDIRTRFTSQRFIMEWENLMTGLDKK